MRLLLLRLFFGIILNTSICAILLSFLRLLWLYSYSSISINYHIIWYRW
nr:MAG TPA: hypothetical protein [Caudoviricetes sp.]